MDAGAHLRFVTNLEKSVTNLEKPATNLVQGVCILSVIKEQHNLPGCGWVCFWKILSQVHLIHVLGGLGSIGFSYVLWST